MAPVIPIQTQFAMERDLDTGEVVIEEYGNDIRGQMDMNDVNVKKDNIQDIDGQKVDVTTGEIVDFKAKRA